MDSTILIVDDEEQVRSVIGEALQKENREMQFASSGYGAMDLLQAKDFNLVITDYRMKFGDGISLAHFCSNRHIPCIVITGFGCETVKSYLPDDCLALDKIKSITEGILSKQVDSILEDRKSATPQNRTLKVLVIEDEPDDFRWLERTLRSIETPRYELSLCTDKHSALQEMLSENYDAFIIDRRLRDGNCIDLMRQARERGCTRPMIMLTGLPSESVDHQAMLSGADDFISKQNLDARNVDRAIRYAVERRRQSQIVTDQQHKLSQALKLSSIGQMTADILHQIKNSLTVICGKVRMIDQKVRAGDEQQKILKDIDVINLAGQKINALVNGLQNFSRDSTSDHFESVVLDDIFDEALSLCQFKIRNSCVEVEYISPGEKIEIECEPVELAQVFLNVICNSIDALEHLQDKWIRVVPEKIDDATVRVSFIDSGSGIPIHIRESILAPYFTTKPRNKGTGLGLSICRMILKKLGGSIELDTNNRNTCFVMTIPLKVGSKLASGRSRRILILDDDPDFSEVAADGLCSLGTQVEIVQAQNTVKALNLLEQNAFDLIISDVIMPGLNGIEFYEHVQNSTMSIKPKFIFLTGFDTSRIPKHIRDASVGVLSKPFFPSLLLDMVKKEFNLNATENF